MNRQKYGSKDLSKSSRESSIGGQAHETMNTVRSLASTTSIGLRNLNLDSI